MTTAGLYALSGIALFGIGFYALIVHSHSLRKILAVNVMSSGLFLVLVAMAERTPPDPPDPVPHAMVLTGVVVAVSATAVALTLVRHIHAVTGSADRSPRSEDTIEAPP